MTNAPRKQKLYCYVDETGQDSASRIFIVVAVVSRQEQDRLREALVAVEREAGTGQRKWHKLPPSRRLRYVTLVLEQRIAACEVFFGSYPKPLPYFLPMLDVLEHAIKTNAAADPYTARVFVDGIDRKKAAELTSVLRLRGISLDMVRSRRDESEPLIRLADMWAGCIRRASEGAPDERALFNKAISTGYLCHHKAKAP